MHSLNKLKSPIIQNVTNLPQELMNTDLLQDDSIFLFINNKSSKLLHFARQSQNLI